jgi:pilus assembly protein CpaF
VAGNTDHEGLKLVLHRYIIDAIEESGKTLEGSRQALSQFVIDKVAEYIARLHLAISRYEMERLAEEIVDELTGFGPLEVLLRDSAVTEILVNGPHRVFIERDGLLHQSDLRFIDAHHVERVMQRILAPLGRRLDESSPMVDARLPDGSRVNAIIPPIALDGPCLSIRKFRQDMLNSTDLMAMQTIDQAIYDFLKEAVGKRCNILISGGTGTGKTTLLNILSQLINPQERLVTIEDIAELQLGHPRGAPGNPSAECRGPRRSQVQRPDSQRPADAPGPHHPRRDPRCRSGRCADRDEHRPRRLDEHRARQQCAGCAAAPGNPGRPDGPQIAERTLRQMICAALDVVIQLTRLPDGRRCVSEVVEVVGIREDVYVTNTLFRLDRRSGFGFMREAVNPAGDKLRRESAPLLGVLKVTACSNRCCSSSFAWPARPVGPPALPRVAPGTQRVLERLTQGNPNGWCRNRPGCTGSRLCVQASGGPRSAWGYG